MPLYGPGRLIGIGRRSLGPLNENGGEEVFVHEGRTGDGQKGSGKTWFAGAPSVSRPVSGESIFVGDPKLGDAPGAMMPYERYLKNRRSPSEPGK